MLAGEPLLQKQSDLAARMTRTQPAAGTVVAFCKSPSRRSPASHVRLTLEIRETSGSDHQLAGMIWDSMGSCGASTKAKRYVLPDDSSPHL
ncbi:hypothetical protein KL86PLE_100456 [uncultured Pleomorphomonas sp.]|uniref:Uncharacterized protein n=1 Tax=uncultured Pleomorphomonas sp. TaxID=442121 RepID=A0A212L401_9HYPH|nr:hypothetical protein KL86PLE_100456 [uncultured Pleomorphomonas sp.]